jgi:hypothetical protein
VKNGCLQVINNEIFDILYSIIFNLEEVPISARKEVAQILEQGLRQTLKYMETAGVLHYAEQNFIGGDNLQQQILEDQNLARALQIKNTLAAWVYLSTWFLSDNSKLKDTKESNLTKGKRKAKKDRTTNEQRAQNDLSATHLANNKTLQLLVSGVLKQPIHYLWPQHKIEEEIVKRLLKCGFDLL